MLYRLLVLLILIPLAILGCTNKSNELADSLPLDEDQPTLIVFYADLWPQWDRLLPIVHGLEEDYGNDVKFVYLNVGEEGKEAFKISGFRGHPSVLLMKPDGKELWRYQGAPSFTDIEKQILEALK